VRRVLLLVVVAAAIAVGAGLAMGSDAVTVNSEALSQSQLNDELAAIDASGSWQCYLQAQALLGNEVVNHTVTGVSARTWQMGTSVQWSDQRATDLAIIQYVQLHDPTALTPAALAATGPASPQGSLELEISLTFQRAAGSASTSGQSFSCTDPAVQTAISSQQFAGLGATTLASMPGWFQHDQLESQAAQLALQALTPHGIPITPASLEAWYGEHASEFDTTCLAVIGTSTSAKAERAVHAIEHGTLTFAEAAKQYSILTNAPKGGGVGCISPTSPGWAAVQQYAGQVPTGKLSPVYPPSGGVPYLIVTPTKRTPNTYADVEPAVLSAVLAANAPAAAVLGAQIQRDADVAVSPTLGAWVETLSGGTIVPPAPPPSSSLLNATANGASG
jgi:hypothetical protein